MGNRQQPTSWSHYVSRYLLRLEIIIISKNNLNSVHACIMYIPNIHCNLRICY